ncbi:putative Dipeptidyl-peptidase [Blattamonas nauphoetae]|uniref:Dipeptidyl-peptidase n=1 Tax=Blattamonas nauphoetae TaxID=2049346 RepID=A0ABQ9X8P1_9EUKA|nr:putative Dipeptidyl-peptidase [Blattamonas nauphoetae]
MLNLVFILISCLFAEPLKPFTEDIYVKLHNQFDLISSPSGQLTAHVDRSYDESSSKFIYILTVIPIIGLPVKSTFADAAISDLVWSSKEKYFYGIVTSSTGSSIRKFDADTLDSSIVNTYPLAISRLAVSPDDTLFAFVCNVYNGLNIERTALEKQKRSLSGKDTMEFTIGPVREVNVITDQTLARGFLYTTNTNKTIQFTPTDATGLANKIIDMPRRFSFSPSGKTIVYASSASSKTYGSTTSLLYLYHISNETTVRLTTSNGLMEVMPCFDPNPSQNRVLFHSTVIANYGQDQFDLTVYDLNTNTTTYLGYLFPSGIERSYWTTHGGHSILCINQHIARQYVSLVDPDAKTRMIPTETYSVLEAALVSDRGQPCLVLIESRSDRPPSLVFCSVSPTPSPTTDFYDPNSEIIQPYHFVKPIECEWVGGLGDTIHGFFFPPATVSANPRQTHKAPLLVLIHGGPEFLHADRWEPMWQVQMFCHRGYACFQPNQHGSTSYGRHFRESVMGHWEEAGFEDVMKGVGHVLSRFEDVVDATRIGAMGWSYGGYLVNCIQARTALFKGLVNFAGVFDLSWQHSQTDIMEFQECEVGGWRPWERRDVYKRMSPSYNISSAATPTLFMHGLLDFRVPIVQSIGAFHASQAQGIPSRLVVFKDDSHHIVVPDDIKRWYQEILGWMDAWV